MVLRLQAEKRPDTIPAAGGDRRWHCLTVIAMIAAAGWWFRTPPPLPVQTRVAVLPLIDRTGDNKLSWTRLGLMSYVSNLFESDGKLRVVADVRVITLADTLHWPDGSDDLARSRLVERLRDVYGATHILAMKLSPEGAALRMDYELVDLGGERHRGTLVGEEGPDLAQGVVQGVYGTLLGITRERDQPAGLQ